MVVGRYCSIAKTVRSTLNDHPLRTLTTHPALYSAAFGVVDADAEMGGSLTIEDDVWIGHNVVILSGCRRIGRGAVIGAGSIVTRDVDRYAVVVGNPARKLKDRFEPELVAAIEESRWWELDLPELRRLVETRRGLVFNPTVGLVREWIEQRGVG
jgi:acetyltransferase-like isoleucine patch superfamily enzyme